MRTLVVSLIILVFSPITGFSQGGNNNHANEYLDMNGAPVKDDSFQDFFPFYNPTVTSSYYYDSIRALTEINIQDAADAYPWISPDGLRLYYTSGDNFDQLVFTQRADPESYFVSPTIIPISISSPNSFWLSADELDVYITNGQTLYYAHRDAVSLPFNWPVSISLTGTTWYFISGASLNAAQDELFLYSASIGMVEFVRTSPSSFNYTKTLNAPQGYSLEVGQLSKDDLTLFVGASYNGGESLLYQMSRATPSDSFDISTFQQVQGINDTTVFNGQPSMSDSLNWVAFVRAVSHTWSADDLFIAHKGTITSVFNPEEIQIYSSVFPNPSSDYLIIDYQSPSNDPVMLAIYSSEGKLVRTITIGSSCRRFKFDTKEIKDGFYSYRLSQINNKNTLFGTGKFIVLH